VGFRGSGLDHVERRLLFAAIWEAVVKRSTAWCDILPHHFYQTFAKREATPRRFALIG
jgi:hypothetical protein